MSSQFRCAGSSADRGEPLAGTASTYRAFLLVESPGAWGPDALASSRLPARVRHGLAEGARRHKVRPLMIRRHGRSQPEQLTVFAGYADRDRPWLETTCVSDPHALLDLDLEALGAGRSLGLPSHDSPLFLVCTHGRHDVCCAERGRPVAAALHTSRPEETWEVSHIGGDRFAGNMLVLPDGLAYGRLTPDSATAVAKEHLAGRLSLDNLRGRCGYGFAVQAAEIFLRRTLGDTRIGSLRLRSARRDDDQVTAMFVVDGSGYHVVVRSVQASPEQLTCQARGASGSTMTTLLSVTQA